MTRRLEKTARSFPPGEPIHPGSGRQGLLKRIGGLFEGYQNSVACEAIRTDLLDVIRRQVNAVSYVKKLLSQAV